MISSLQNCWVVKKYYLDNYDNLYPSLNKVFEFDVHIICIYASIYWANQGLDQLMKDHLLIWNENDVKKLIETMNYFIYLDQGMNS